MQTAAKTQRRLEAGFNWETLRRGRPLKRERIGNLLAAGSLRFARRLIGFAVKIMGNVTGDSMTFVASTRFDNDARVARDHGQLWGIEFADRNSIGVRAGRAGSVRVAFDHAPQ